MNPMVTTDGLHISSAGRHTLCQTGRTAQLPSLESLAFPCLRIMTLTYRFLASLLFGALALSAPLSAQPSITPVPDPTFNDGEAITTFFAGNWSWGWGVQMYPDGRMVAVAASQNSPVIVRYLPDGTLDPSFGDGSGYVVTPIRNAEDAGDEEDTRAEPGSAGHIELMADGRIVVSLYRQIVRLLPDGTLDETFGTGGITVIPSTHFFWSSRFTIVPDGSIYWTGFGRDGSTVRKFVLVKLSPDGIPDESFGPNGVKLFGPDSQRSHDIRFDGAHLWVVGSPLVGSSNTNGASVARVNLDGTLDETFGSGGFRVISDMSLAVLAMGFQSDGRLVVAGTDVSNNFNRTFAMRFTFQGQLDTSFGEEGIVYTPTHNTVGNINNLVILPDNRILAIGNQAFISFDSNGNGSTIDETAMVGAGWIANLEALSLLPNGQIVVTGFARRTSPPLTTDQFFLRRFNTSLTYTEGSEDTVDETFGTDGILLADDGTANLAHSRVHLPDGKTLLVGGNSTGEGDYRLTILRILPEGLPDPSFGSEGLVQVRMPFGTAFFTRLQDGSYLATGSRNIDGVLTHGAAHFSSEGVQDTDFGEGGFVYYPEIPHRIFNGSFKTHLLPDGRVLVLSTVITGSNVTDALIAVLKINPDGSLDPSFGDGGFALVGIGDFISHREFFVAADGRIYISFHSNHGDPIGVAVLNPDGTPASGFGTNGIVRINVPAGVQPSTIYVDNNGKIFVFAYNLMIRLLADGSLDSSFGNNGIAELDFSLPGEHITQTRALQTVALADGRFLLAGLLFSSYFPQQGFVGRVTAEGVVDSEFGSHGSVRYMLSSLDIFRHLHVDGNGRAIAIGDTRFAGVRKLLVTALDAGSPGTSSSDPNATRESISVALYPNPVSHSATLAFELMSPVRVEAVLYDLLGRRVRTVVDEDLGVGAHTVRIDAAGLSSGMYIVRLQAGGAVHTQRLTIVR